MNTEAIQPTQGEAPATPVSVTADTMTADQLKAQIESMTQEPKVELVYPNGQPDKPQAEESNPAEEASAPEEKEKQEVVEPDEKQGKEVIDYERRYKESSKEAHRLLEENRKLSEKLNLLLEAKLEAQTQKASEAKPQSAEDISRLKEEWNERFREDPAGAMADFLQFYGQQWNKNVLSEVEKRERSRLEESVQEQNTKVEIEQIYKDYPDLKNEKSEFYQKANEHYARLAQKHPNLSKSPEIFRLASEYATIDLKQVKTLQESKTKGIQQARMEMMSELESNRTGSVPSKPARPTMADVEKMSAEEFAKTFNLPTAYVA